MNQYFDRRCPPSGYIRSSICTCAYSIPCTYNTDTSFSTQRRHCGIDQTICSTHSSSPGKLEPTPRFLLVTRRQFDPEGHWGIKSLVRVSLHKQLHNYAFIPGTINLSVSTFSRFPNVTNSTFSFIVHSHMHRTLSLQLIFTNISIIVRFQLISINNLSSWQLIIHNRLDRTTSQHILIAMCHPRQSSLSESG